MSNSTFRDETQSNIRERLENRAGGVNEDSNFICDDLSDYWKSIIERNQRIKDRLKLLREDKLC